MRRCLFALCCAAASAWAQVPPEFRYTIALATPGSEGLYRAELPLAVYQAAARADLSDLRVFNARGEVVPFAFAGAPDAEAVRQPAAALPIFPVRKAPHGAAAGATANLRAGAFDLQVRQTADGTLVSLHSAPVAGRTAAPVPMEEAAVYLVDASRFRLPIRALTIDWQPGVDARVGSLSVDAGDDLKSWHSVAAAAPLIDLQFNGEKLVQRRIEFAPTAAKYLRLTWNGTPFVITQVLAETNDAASQRRFAAIRVPATPLAPGESAQPVPAAAGTDYYFDLGARAPVERLGVALPQANTVAPARLFARDDPKGQWRFVTQTTLYRLVRDGVEIVSPPIEIATRSDRYWLLRVDQRGGGLGTGTPALEAQWQPRHIVFVARGEAPYVIAYGNREPGIEPAGYVLSSLIPGYERNAEFKLPEARAGAAQSNGPEPSPSIASMFAKGDGKRIALWTILLAGVALLAWMAWRLSRQMGAADAGKKLP